MGSIALILVLLAPPGFTPPDDLAEIVQLQRSGRYDEAWNRSVALYNAGRRDPALVQAIQSLGLRLGRYDELKTLLQLGEGRELTVREQLLWADILLRTGRTDEGLAVLDGMVAAAGPARLSQAIGVLTSRGMVAEAIRLARQQRQRVSPGDASWGMTTRELVSLSSREGLAPDCVREALALVSADASSFAWAADQVGRVPGVTRDIVIEALSAVPASPRSHSLAASLLLKAGYPEDGLALLLQGVGAKPRELLEYATACRAEGAYDTASDAYLQALAAGSSRPDTMAALEGLTAAFNRSGALDEAADWARRLLALGPQGAQASEARLVLARAALGAGDPESAVDHAREALQHALGDQKTSALWLEAEAQLVLGNIERADTLYASLARQWPSDTLANDCLARVSVLADSCAGVTDFARGIGLRWQGRFGDAALSFAEAATSCPGSVIECEARLEAGRSWFLDGDLRAAESWLHEAGEDTACAAKVLMMLGEVLIADSRMQEAAQKLERLLLEFPDSPMVVPARRELGRIRSGQVP